MVLASTLQKPSKKGSKIDDFLVHLENMLISGTPKITFFQRSFLSFLLTGTEKIPVFFRYISAKKGPFLEIWIPFYWGFATFLSVIFKVNFFWKVFFRSVFLEKTGFFRVFWVLKKWCFFGVFYHFLAFFVVKNYADFRYFFWKSAKKT